MDTQIPYLNEWLNLARSGNFEKAQEIYYEKLFGAVIDNFKTKHSEKLPSGGILFSILGFSGANYFNSTYYRTGYSCNLYNE